MALASCPARQGQQRSLCGMRQVLSWGVGAFPGRPWLGVDAVSVFLRGGLAASPVGDADVAASARVALVGQDHQAGGGEFAQDAPDPGGGQIVHRPGAVALIPRGSRRPGWR